MYDIIVVGGGHAGCEAAHISNKLNKKTLLISGNLNKLASMPCNPSIGGPAKGIVVREIDALGGLMGKLADKNQIQMKLLNRSKGPAVRALRGQIDKYKYMKSMKEELEKQKNLELKEAMVVDLIVEDNTIKGVILDNNEKIYSKAVIITTGTYLDSRTLRGSVITHEGPWGEKTTKGISDRLRKLGFEIKRLKTGTPPRIKSSTINYDEVKLEPGDSKIMPFSLSNEFKDITSKNIPCYLTYTNLDTHKIIMDNLSKSAMYGGIVEGTGTRYCPSIEDKVVRFNTKNSHQIFLEPEDETYEETYLQGLSTSMPIDVQEILVKSVKGLENAVITKYAFAIEYDAIDSTTLRSTLESKIVNNLYCAGQINGTSGYEEAACQGLMAGINASLKIDNKEPFILKRNEAYIGILIDDLVTKGVLDPYRLFTSRSEYRSLLRNDNVDFRLRDYGYKLNLVSDEEYKLFEYKKEKVKELTDYFNNNKIKISNEVNNYLESINSTPLKESILIKNLIKRPEINYSHIKHLLNLDVEDIILEHIEINIKYNDYIKKELEEVEKIDKMENKLIPEDINYFEIHNIASEAKDKLSKIRPRSLAQASRISGVNPNDIAILLVYLESRKNV